MMLLLPLFISVLSAPTGAMRFHTFRSFRSVTGGGDSLAAGTGALVGYGNVDFGRSGLAGADVVSGGVDGGGDFDAAVQLVSGRRGKAGATAESALLLSKAGAEDQLLERGSFSLSDGLLKTRRLKDLLYKESDAGAKGVQEASYSNAGERTRANDTSGFKNSYHLDESGSKSSFSDKYRQASKFGEAGAGSKRRETAEGRRREAARLEAEAEAARADSEGSRLRGRQRASKEQRLVKAGLKKYLKEGEEARQARRKFLKKGDIADLDDVDMIDVDEDYDGDGSEIDEQRHYLVV